MSFCPKCGKQLADGEVCSCQTAQTARPVQPQMNAAQQAAPSQQHMNATQQNMGQMNQQYMNGMQMNQPQMNAAPKAPSQPPAFLNEIADLFKGLFKKPADAVAAYVSKSSLATPFIIIAVLSVIRAISSLIHMIGVNIEYEMEAAKNVNPWVPSTWVVAEPVYTVAEIALGVFGAILYTFAAAALFAAIIMVLINFLFEKDNKVTFSQTLAVASLSFLVAIPLSFVANIIGLIPLGFFDTVGGWISTFGSAVGYVFTFIGIKAIEKDDNHMPLVYGIAMVLLAVLSSVFRLAGLL